MLDSNTVNKTVTLDGHVYVVSSHVVEDNASEFAATINQTAPQYDERNPPVSTWTMDAWTGGLGIKWANFREHQGRYWFGYGVDTRFARQLTLGPLVNTAVATNPGDTLGTTDRAAYMFLNGKEYFALSDKIWSWDASTLTEVADRGSSTTQWGYLSKFTDSTNTVRAYAFPDVGSASHSVYLSTDGGANWSVSAGPIVGISSLEYDNHFIVLGGTDTIYQIDTADAPDGALASYTTLFQFGTSTYVIGVPRRAILFRNAAGDIVPYVVVARSTSEATGAQALGQWYVMDYYARSLRPVNLPPFRMTINDHTGAVVWNNSLYYVDSGGSVFKYDVDAYQDIGITNDQGVTPLYQGAKYLQHLAATPRWLYATGTNADVYSNSQNSTLLAYNGIGWHGLALDPATQPPRGLFASELTPGRIYWISGTGTTANLYYINESAVGGNPVNDTAYTYATSGTLVTPWVDLGFADLTKTLLSMTIDCDNLSATASGEYVNVQYNLNGVGDDGWADGNQTNLGNFLSGTKTLYFGTIDSNNNYPGIAAKSIRFKILLSRGATTTNTPIVRALVLRYLVNVPYRVAAQFTVDIGATIQEVGAPFQRAEDVVSALKTTYGKTTLVDYAYGNDTARKVKMVTMPVREWSTEAGDRNGQISVQVLQPVA